MHFPVAWAVDVWRPLVFLQHIQVQRCLSCHVSNLLGVVWCDGTLWPQEMDTSARGHCWYAFLVSTVFVLKLSGFAIGVNVQLTHSTESVIWFTIPVLVALYISEGDCWKLFSGLPNFNKDIPVGAQNVKSHFGSVERDRFIFRLGVNILSTQFVQQPLAIRSNYSLPRPMSVYSVRRIRKRIINSMPYASALYDVGLLPGAWGRPHALCCSSSTFIPDRPTKSTVLRDRAYGPVTTRFEMSLEFNTRFKWLHPEINE